MSSPKRVSYCTVGQTGRDVHVHVCMYVCTCVFKCAHLSVAASKNIEIFCAKHCQGVYVIYARLVNMYVNKLISKIYIHIHNIYTRVHLYEELQVKRLIN